MASITRTIDLPVDAATLWARVADFARPQALAPGFAVACTAEAGARTVTFANGAGVRELLVTSDPAARRLVYAATGGRSAHHQASMLVDEAAGGARLTWTTDVLPDALAPAIGQAMDAGAAAMRAAFA